MALSADCRKRTLTTVSHEQGSLKEGAMLVKGTDRCGNFELRLPPSTAMAPEGWAMHAREMEVMNTNYLARHGHK